MESFFVPIFLKLGKLSEEKLLVALIMVTPQKIWIKYSQKRIQLTSQVINAEYSSLAKEVLDQIQIKAGEVNAMLAKTGEIQFNHPHIFNADYFEYLKKYSQNTLLFGNIEAFNFQNSALSFESLYESLMNEKTELPRSVKPDFHNKIKKSLTESGIDDKADIGLKITPDKLAGLYYDTTVTLISRNGGIFAAEAIDFTNGIPALANALNAFEVLINSLNIFSKQKNLNHGTYHIVNSVPAPGSEQEKLLNNIYKNKKEVYTAVPEDAIGEITGIIKSGNFMKFSMVLT